MKKLKTLHIQDYETAALQNNVLEFTEQLVGQLPLSGLLIEDITVVNGIVTNVNHGLGREVCGWYITKIDQNSNIWQTASSIPKSTLILNSSYVGTTTISIWVF